MTIYWQLDNIVTFEKGIISINICKNKFLDIFEIIEIFNYIVEKYNQDNIKSTIIDWNCELKDYLDRINFNFNLNVLFWIKNLNENIHTWNNDLLQEIKIFSNKNEFYVINEKILNMLWRIWLSDDTSYLVLSSLWEIVDNSFFHNLWRWQTKFWPKCILLIQNYPKIKKLSFVISDLWIWFSNTLKDNHPWLNTEKDYIEIALKPWITWRYQNKWWNWLVYLQKNIFNWFKWELKIRSNNSLVKVEDFGKIIEIQNDINLSWVNISFSLFY